MTFWNTSSSEQKLAQLDGGIECRLTSTQIALNLGAPNGSAVRTFAMRHGRNFAHSDRDTEKARTAAKVVNSHRIFRQRMEASGLDMASSLYARIFPKEETGFLVEPDYFEEA